MVDRDGTALSDAQCRCPSFDKAAEAKSTKGEAPAKPGASQSCFGRLFVPNGPSGHSLVEKVQFASSLFSIFNVLAVVGLAKDLFIEKFGCDVTIIGTLFMVISFWTPLNQFIHGNLQDRQCLARFFPIAEWGRRAPWFLTHTFIASGAAVMMYLPPTYNQTVLHAWFFVMAFLANWGVSSSLIAFESARVEVYPFKEERILVEGICKYTCMFGGGSGAGPMMILLISSTFTLRLGLSFFILLMSLVSLWAVPMLKRAKATTESNSLGGIMSVFAQANPWGKHANKAMQHLMAVKCWHGAYGSSIATVLLYYITYVLQLSGWNRNFVLGGAACSAALTEMICNCFYMWIFGTGDSRADKTGRSDRNLLVFVVIMRILNAVATVLLMGVAEPSVTILFVWVVTTRICVCGFSFWKISAQCWLVDEDCQFGAEPGRRREGIMFGAMNMIQNFSGAFLSSAVFIGLGLAGLKTKNCNAECEGAAASCEDICFTGVIYSQPASLLMFVRLVIGVWAPFCELMVAFHAWHFPIKGARLRKLNNAIRQSRGEDIAGDDALAVVPTDLRGRVDQMAAHRATSKMAVQLSANQENQHAEDVAKLAHLIEFTHARPGPKSIAVFFEFDEGCDLPESPSGPIDIEAPAVPCSVEAPYVAGSASATPTEELCISQQENKCYFSADASDHVDIEAPAASTDVDSGRQRSDADCLTTQQEQEQKQQPHHWPCVGKKIVNLGQDGFSPRCSTESVICNPPVVVYL